MTTDQIIQSRAKFREGDLIHFEGLNWRVTGFAYKPQTDELIYLVERHDHVQPKTISEKELSVLT